MSKRDIIVLGASACGLEVLKLCGKPTSFPRLCSRLTFTQAEDRALRRRNPSAVLRPGFSGSVQFPPSP